tara:strand:+ start:638 stop:1366 length:729 start_codon:yes stop_codon:yes gene_type:complete
MQVLNSLFNPIEGKNTILNYSPLWMRDQKFNYLNLYDHIKDRNHDQFIISPAFHNFISRNNRTYDKYLSKPYKQMGFFNIFAWEKSLGNCMHSPTHSYSIISSNNQEDISKNIFISAFGQNSVFQYLLDKDFYSFQIGTPIINVLTIIHYIEQLMKVPYRELISFPVKIFSKKTFLKSINYEYYSRSDYRYKDNGSSLIKSSLEKNIIKHYSSRVSLFRLRDIVDLGIELIKTNPYVFVNSD